MAKSKVDRYGRVLIPKDIRDKLNLNLGDPVVISVRGHDLVLRKEDIDLHERVREWVEFIRRANPKPFVNEAKIGDSKWLSREYCLRKLGL